jgi:hypothetical protein
MNCAACPFLPNHRVDSLDRYGQPFECGIVVSRDDDLRGECIVQVRLIAGGLVIAKRCAELAACVHAGS